MARSKKSIAKKKKPSVKLTAKKNKNVSKKAVKKSQTRKVTAIPKNYSCVTPYLILNNAAKAIEFYKKVFNAKERMRIEYSGKIGHAELKIGDAIIMLSDKCPEKNAMSPNSFGGGNISIYLYVKDVDSVFKKAISLGAKVIREIENMFYGDRSGGIEDPFGHQWFIATHVEDVTLAKVKKRAQELFNQSSSKE
jgi:PhnB protein